MKLCSKIVVLLLFSFQIKLNAQRFGGNPPSLKWKQTTGKTSRVIFTPGFEDAAKRIAAITDVIASQKNGNLGKVSKPISIVIQPNPVVSNAYVGLAPWRSEFYAMPLQNSLQLGSTNWMDNLAIHEYRHVHQYSNFRKGLSKFAYIIAGEEGQALANAASIPDWFFEGDAVYTETQYLSQGRGRLPYFFDPFNAVWFGNKHYSFQKLRNGSLRDFIPDHYALGYMLVRYGYEKYGNEFWGKVTDDAVRFRGLTYPFQKAVKKYSGVDYKQFVASAIEAHRSTLSLTDTKNVEAAFNRVDNKRVVEYLYPSWVGEDSVVALRKAFNELPKWVIFSNGKMNRLGVKDIGIDDYFTYENNQIAYTSYHPDLRWQWKEFNDVFIYDISNQVSNQITFKQRYFSPDLSSDGLKIASVHVNASSSSEIHVIDVAEKKLLKTFENKEKYFYSYPCFSSNNQLIYAIARKKTGESGLVSIDVNSGTETVLSPFKNTPISLLRVKGQDLIFTLSNEKRNELWKYDLNENRFEVLSSAQIGSYSGDINAAGTKVIYSKPTAEGEQLFVAQIEKNKPAAEISDAQLVQPVSSTEGIDELLKKTSYELTSIESYKKSTKPFNFHSWRPFYEQPEWSFTLYGQNLLNTVETSMKYVYNENEGSHRFGFNGAYGSLFPWIIGGTDYTFSRTFKDNTRNYKWNEWTGNVGLRLPLNFTRGKLFRNLELATQLNGVKLVYDPKSVPLLPNKWVTYASQQIIWSMQTQQALQHIYPKFAFATRITNKSAIGKTSANQLYFGSQLYLPGIGKNHSLVTAFSYQQRDTLKQYIFSNGFAMARGYEALDYPRMWKASFNYHMPLLYPDFGIANIVYFQRIRSNFFYDAMWLKSLRTGVTTNLRSTGAEIYFDTKWWNQQPVSFGVRYSHLLDVNKFTNKPNANRWEFVLPINLIPN
jgi:hypothetical protein